MKPSAVDRMMKTCYKIGDIIEHAENSGIVLAVNEDRLPRYTMYHFQMRQIIETNFYTNTGERLIG